jgi:hypothetical protein
MSRIFRRIVAPILAVLAALSSAHAASLVEGKWYKSCEGDACITGIRVPDADLTFLIRVDPAVRQPIVASAQVSLDVEHHQDARMTWQMNNSPSLHVPYAKCTAQGCLAQVELDQRYLVQLRRATEYRLGFTVADEKKVIDVPLEGFAEAFDGPATAALDDLFIHLNLAN